MTQCNGRASPFHRLSLTNNLLGSPRGLHGPRGHPRFVTRGETYRPGSCSLDRNLGQLLLIYLWIGCRKEVIAVNPYSWGEADHYPPGYTNPYRLAADLVEATHNRMLIALAVFYVTIEVTATVGVLLFDNSLGPSLAGTLR